MKERSGVMKQCCLMKAFCISHHICWFIWFSTYKSMNLQVKGNILGMKMYLVYCLFVATPSIKNALKVSCLHTHNIRTIKNSLSPLVRQDILWKYNIRASTPLYIFEEFKKKKKKKVTVNLKFIQNIYMLSISDQNLFGLLLLIGYSICFT